MRMEYTDMSDEELEEYLLQIILEDNEGRGKGC